MRAAWKRWRYRREQRIWEVFLFNTGAPKWAAVRDVNTVTGVWRRYPL